MSCYKKRSTKAKKMKIHFLNPVICSKFTKEKNTGMNEQKDSFLLCVERLHYLILYHSGATSILANFPIPSTHLGRLSVAAGMQTGLPASAKIGT